MASVHDVAAFIVRELGPTTAMKLEKLVYYAQAWSLAWDGAPMFSEPVEAWTNGPIVRELFDRHRGMKRVNFWEGDPGALTDLQAATAREVVRFYGDRDAEWLSDLTHREPPWRDARPGVPDGRPSRAVIANDAMRAYYGSIACERRTLSDAYGRGLELMLSMAPDEFDSLTDPTNVSSDEVVAWLEGRATLPGDA